MYRALSLGACLTFMVCSHASAGELVDHASPLQTVRTDFGLADGPSWDDRGTLYVPDVKGEQLFRFAPAKKQWSVVLPQAGRVSASFYNLGTLYLADNGEAAISRLAGKQKVVIARNDPDAKPPQRPNDLVVDNAGGIYYTLTAVNRVMYVSPEGRQQVAVEGIETPNGIALSPDGSRLYVASYAPKKIWVYDIAAPGNTTGGRELCAMDDGPEKGADGMTVDRAGNIYCAGATDVWIWSPSGKLLEKIATPTRPINCTFGDSDMQTLYITAFGGVYRQHMNISGRAPQPPLVATDESADTTRPSTAVPKNITPYLDVVYAEVGDRKLLADLFVPQSPAGLKPTIVVVHGGGWLKGDKTKFRALSIELARRGYVTACIEYRLGGEALFPAGIQDCNAAVRYLRAHAQRYDIDPQRIGAVGGSAGGHLVGLMATASDEPKLQEGGGYHDRSAKLQAAIVMAGPMQMITGSVAERSREGKPGSNSNVWLGGTVDELPDLYRLADAYEHITADDPPLLFMVGEHDTPERNAPSREKFTSLGVPTGVKIYADAHHGCWNQLPWFNDMATDMDAFFQQHLKK